jgi:hypothetical protein
MARGRKKGHEVSQETRDKVSNTAKRRRPWLEAYASYREAQDAGDRHQAQRIFSAFWIERDREWESAGEELSADELNRLRQEYFAALDAEFAKTARLHRTRDEALVTEIRDALTTDKRGPKPRQENSMTTPQSTAVHAPMVGSHDHTHVHDDGVIAYQHSHDHPHQADNSHSDHLHDTAETSGPVRPGLDQSGAYGAEVSARWPAQRNRIRNARLRGNEDNR